MVPNTLYTLPFIWCWILSLSIPLSTWCIADCWKAFSPVWNRVPALTALPVTVLLPAGDYICMWKANSHRCWLVYSSVAAGSSTESEPDLYAVIDKRWPSSEVLPIKYAPPPSFDESLSKHLIPLFYYKNGQRYRLLQSSGLTSTKKLTRSYTLTGGKRSYWKMSLWWDNFGLQIFLGLFSNFQRD